MRNAERFVERGVAEFLNATTLRFVPETERRAIQLEQAAQARRRADVEVDERIAESRFAQVSWSGSKRSRIPWSERVGMVPLCPGTVRS